MFAIQRGAKSIFDFDDDNILLWADYDTVPPSIIERNDQQQDQDQHGRVVLAPMPDIESTTFCTV
jgi:hypothetical protein